MSLDSSDSLARMLGTSMQEQDTIKQNLSPDDPDAQLQFGFSDSLLLSGTTTAVSRLYATDSFIPDHPVYGELDRDGLNAVATAAGLAASDISVYIPFTDNAGVDLSQYGWNATINPAYATSSLNLFSQSNTAFDLTNTTVQQKIYIPNTWTEFESGNLSIFIVCKTPASFPSGEGYFVGKYNWQIYISSAGRVSFRVGRMNNSTGPSYTASTPVGPDYRNGTWNSFCGIYSPGSPGYIQMYANGTLASTLSISTDIIWTGYGSADNNYSVNIGSSPHGASVGVQMSIAALIITRTAMTGPQIQALHNLFFGSPFLYLDGGYQTGGVTVPITMPLTFDTPGAVLYTTTY